MMKRRGLFAWLAALPVGVAVSRGAGGKPEMHTISVAEMPSHAYQPVVPVRYIVKLEEWMHSEFPPHSHPYPSAWGGGSVPAGGAYAIPASPVPAGTVMAFVGDEPPAGWTWYLPDEKKG